MAETWERVVGYERTYEVSDLGCVRRIGRARGARCRLMKRSPNSHGYAAVRLTQDGVGKLWAVHTLVARAFLGPQPKGIHVNHKNGNRNDPRLENLEYVTPSENQLHSYRVLGIPRRKARGEACRHAILTEQKVREIRSRKAAGESTSVLAYEYGVKAVTIRHIITRRLWKHVH